MEEILKTREIVFTLADVGASGEIYKPFMPLAGFSKIIRFDPDLRELKQVCNDKYYDLITLNKAVISDDKAKCIRFYFTDFPLCSSTLYPNYEKLSKYQYIDCFKVIEEKDVPAITLNKVLDDLDIQSYDWIKLDAQGTDLEIIKSIKPEIFNQLIIVDIELGFYRHYVGSSTFDELLKFMIDNGFWVSDIYLQNQIRMSKNSFGELTNNMNSLMRKFFLNVIKRSPTAVETRFVRSIDSAKKAGYTKDMFIKMWALSIYSNNIPYALNILYEIKRDYNNDEMIKKMWSMTEGYLKKRALYSGLAVILKTLLKKGKSIFIKY